MIPLVKLLCCRPRCGLLLDNVESAPAPGDEDRWAGYVPIHICPKHGEGAGHGNIRAWQERQRRAGKPYDRVQTGRYIQWAELRPSVERARLTGRTQKYPV